MRDDKTFKAPIQNLLGELMKAVKVETDGSIKLPKEMLRLFPTSSELAVWTEGDMLRMITAYSPTPPKWVDPRTRGARS